VLQTDEFIKGIFGYTISAKNEVYWEHKFYNNSKNCDVRFILFNFIQFIMYNKKNIMKLKIELFISYVNIFETLK